MALDLQSKKLLWKYTPKDRQFPFHGPHYLGVLRHTDIPETAELLADTVRVYGEVPERLRSARPCPSLEECLR